MPVLEARITLGILLPKATTMSHAITLAAELGMVHIEFEADSQPLLEALDI